MTQNQAAKRSTEASVPLRRTHSARVHAHMHAPEHTSSVQSSAFLVQLPKITDRHICHAKPDYYPNLMFAFRIKWHRVMNTHGAVSSAFVCQTLIIIHCEMKHFHVEARGISFRPNRTQLLRSLSRFAHPRVCRAR